MRLGSSFSAVAKPFQPQAASSATLVASPPRGSVDPAGPRGSSPAAAAIETPIHRGSPIPHQVSDEGETPLIPPPRTGRPGGGGPEEEIGVATVIATQKIATPQS